MALEHQHQQQKAGSSTAQQQPAGTQAHAPGYLSNRAPLGQDVAQSPTAPAAARPDFQQGSSQPYAFPQQQGVPHTGLPQNAHPTTTAPATGALYPASVSNPVASAPATPQPQAFSQPVAPHPAAPTAPSATNSTPSPTWATPQYEGRDLSEWIEQINELKRKQRLSEALELATGCANAMVEAARQNPAQVQEFYIIQVAIIQHKMKDYANEVAMLESWFALGLPVARPDYDVDLRKRLAKARELLARAQGRDPRPFYMEWQRWVALGKQQAQAAGQCGRGALRRRPSSDKFIPTPQQLLEPAFVTVDFETANRKGGASACQVALVKMVQGLVVDRYATLLRPAPEYADFEFTYLHGISAQDVAQAPTWAQVAGYIQLFVADLPVYAHNAAFDARVWRELDAYYGVKTLPKQFYCTYRTAKQEVPGLENYKLPTVVQACAPGYRLDHHKADSDAEACALIVVALQHVVSGYEGDVHVKL